MAATSTASPAGTAWHLHANLACGMSPPCAFLSTKSNQTTLGHAVKFHHRFGSKEAVDLLHDYGFAVKYDEVLIIRYCPYCFPHIRHAVTLE